MIKVILRMRKYLAAWGALFFCVLCFTLYLMLESLANSSHRSPIMDENIVAGIENKIVSIESDMKHNRELIISIKTAVREMNKGDLAALDKVVWGKNTAYKLSSKTLSNETRARKISLSEKMCSWADRPIAASDINMFRLYETLTFEDNDGGVWKQGWDIRYSMNLWEKKKLRVFVVPHSHCDPGWIKTYDKYFSDQVVHILNNMMKQLDKDKRKKFIFAEMSFFSRWWDTLTQTDKDIVKRILKNGQLELVTGGWVMNDEATAHYSAIVNQLTEGHLWLNNTLGYKPTTHWTIDPFGYSATNPYLIRQAGITAMLIQRVHYAVKRHLAVNKQLEFMWRQQWDNEGTSDIFTHTMPFYSYDIPHTCGPDPKVCCQFDFDRLPGSRNSCPWGVAPQHITRDNVDVRSRILMDQYRKKASLYKTNVLFVPLGDDFRYDKPDEWDAQFMNYQALFDHINSHPKMRAEVQFGTLSDYFTALHEEEGTPLGQPPPSIPYLTGDFFSYNDRNDNYWTGFFTSRPFYKHLDRELEHHLRAAEIVFSLTQAYARHHGNTPEIFAVPMEMLVSARRSLSLFQHHDGITGTAKDFVVQDYGEKLVKALMDCKQIISAGAHFLVRKDKTPAGGSPTFFHTPPMFDIDESRASHDSLPQRPVIRVSDQSRSILVFNSLTKERTNVVTMHVDNVSVEIVDSRGLPVLAQVQPFWTELGHIADSVFVVSFVATVPALGVSTYSVKLGQAKSSDHLSDVTIINADVSMPTKSPHFKVHLSAAKEYSISSKYLTAQFNKDGLLKSVTNKITADVTKLHISFVKYTAKESREMGGAYLFLPNGPAEPIRPEKPTVRVISGQVLSEVHMIMPEIEHIVRVVNSRGVEGACLDIRNIVDIRHQTNVELAMRLSADIVNTDRVFYTDQNGFQMQQRKTHDKIPLQGNFYPMTTNVIIEDKRKRLNIMSGQSLGVSSLEQGQVELMLDRRLNQDDNRGLGQSVIDNKRTPNVFRVLVECKNGIQAGTTTTVYPTLSAHWALLQLIHPTFVFPEHHSLPKRPDILPQFSPLLTELPCDVHLLNLRSLVNADHNDDASRKFVPTSHVALMVHRVGFDCSSHLPDMQCAFTNGKLNLSKIFQDLKVTDTKRTSLTLLHDHQPVTNTTIPSMHIHTYQIKLQ